jgi:hypothetical protein
VALLGQLTVSLKRGRITEHDYHAPSTDEKLLLPVFQDIPHLLEYYLDGFKKAGQYIYLSTFRGMGNEKNSKNGVDDHEEFDGGYRKMHFSSITLSSVIGYLRV